MHVTRPDAEPIFPSLRCFYTTYHATVDPSNPFYEFVFQSQLVHLQVTSVASVSNLLSYTDRSSNTLQSLHFIERSHNLHSGHYRELLTTIARLTCLTDLHIPSAFVPAVFQTLSSKTNLRHLGITQYPGEAHDEDHRILFPKDGFIHLESFTLQDFSPRPHDHFTIASAHHQLRTLHIELAKIELDDYRNYFMKISLGFPNMERLCIKSYTREHHWDPRNCLPAFGILEPLLALSNIRDFGFHTDIPFSLSDEEIDDIAQAWPQLEEFLFCKDALYTDVEGPELTLWGLISFAEHCPRLRTLTLPISAKIEPDLDPTETPSFNERFSYLNLAFSPIWGFSEELALCLAALLPNGAELTFEEGEGGREREDSHRVEDWCMMRSFVTSVVKERAAGSGDTIEVWESLPDEQDE
ncbi:hypothetical protein SISSUDRAFT_818032 [Sistotremastrum suecicum HHB10207 ss-3]|uniref:F-box domain-containing protein n=1 Tax=Sistotremastrum suecicum HHB10207 ss-3 TaxID=1314776 RepID=A0A166CV68_9AGAM|nr:hypothetical protein SISSUDRAFT_818032 [Sistotremastrum suecicum HHB10207 ss-3]